METDSTINVLDALAQRTRLHAMELLLRNEPNGLSSGDVARALKVPPNTMSTHLAKLSHAGLVRAERHNRFIVYRANRKRLVSSLVALVDRYQANLKSSKRRTR